LSPTEIRGEAFKVLEEALKSTDWKERLGAARIVLSKVDDDEEIDEGVDVYEAAMRRHDERQVRSGIPDNEDED